MPLQVAYGATWVCERACLRSGVALGGNQKSESDLSAGERQKTPVAGEGAVTDQYGARQVGVSHSSEENAKNYINGRFLSVNLQNSMNAAFPIIFYDG